MSGPSRVPVSVVIPCYRCSDVLQRAVASVLRQKRLPIELVLVEDGDGDSGATGLEIARIERQHAGRLEIKTVKFGKNSGPGSARNAGWDVACQPFVAFLDADDIWHPDKLGLQYQWMLEHSHAAICACRSTVLPEGVEMFRAVVGSIVAERITRRSILFSNRIPMRSVMARRDLPVRFENLKRFAEDYQWLCESIWEGYETWLIDVPLVGSYKAPFGAGGLSKRLWAMEKGNLHTYWRMVTSHGLQPPLCAVVVMWSILKYIRRLGICSIRNMLTQRTSLICHAKRSFQTDQENHGGDRS